MNPRIESYHAFQRGLEPLFGLMTPEQIRQLADLRGDSALAERLSDLADKANEDELSIQERDEYEAYLDANDFLAIMQAGARFRLTRSES
jgi:hypothetical protein